MSQNPDLPRHQPSPAQNQLQIDKPEPIQQEKQQISINNHQIPPQKPLQNGSQAPIQEQEPESSKSDPEIRPEDDPKINPENSAQNSNRIQSNYKINSFNLSNGQKVPSCHCKKSKCLKMYCDCFAKGNKCRDTCKCIGCQNTKNSNRQKKPDSRNDEEIQKSQDSNKKSIKPKERSCNCKKSFCLKKYCECYNANIPCTQSCKCEDCKNNGENNGFRDDKTPGIGSQLDQLFINPTLNKQISEAVSEPNGINEKKEEVNARKRQKPDQDEIETKLSQILRLVPQQNYQTMLDFLAYCLS